jgi:hypothetical protein
LGQIGCIFGSETAATKGSTGMVQLIIDNAKTMRRPLKNLYFAKDIADNAGQ